MEWLKIILARFRSSGNCTFLDFLLDFILILWKQANLIKLIWNCWPEFLSFTNYHFLVHVNIQAARVYFVSTPKKNKRTLSLEDIELLFVFKNTLVEISKNWKLNCVRFPTAFHDSQTADVPPDKWQEWLAVYTPGGWEIFGSFSVQLKPARGLKNSQPIWEKNASRSKCPRI